MSLVIGLEKNKVSTNTAWYNTKQGIQESMQDLSLFHKMIDERRTAGIYGRHEDLDAFIILGRWFLFSDGNFGKLHVPIVPWIYDPVVESNTYQEIGMIGFIQSGYLPKGAEKSVISGKKWDVYNAYDFMHIEGKGSYTLDEYLSYITEFWKGTFKKCLLDAGFSDTMVFLQKPNQYWPYQNSHERDSLSGPWFDVITDIGMIEIGNRKRVTHCAFSEKLNIDCNKMITDKVTKGTHMFHADTNEKLTEYLALVRKNIFKKKN